MTERVDVAVVGGGQAGLSTGLYFMGVHLHRKSQSATLYGVDEDAEMLARHIVEDRA